MFGHEKSEQYPTIKFACLGRMNYLLNNNIKIPEATLLQENPSDIDSWKGVDIGFIFADTIEEGIIDELHIIISAAKKENVLIVPIILSTTKLDLDAVSLRFVNDEELIKNVGHSIKSICDISCIPGLINLDLSDLKSILNGKGEFFLGLGKGYGKNACIEAGRQAVNNLSKVCGSENVKGILMNFVGNENNLSMMEIMNATNEVHNWITNDSCNIIWGASTDNSLINEVHVFIMMRN